VAFEDALETVMAGHDAARSLPAELANAGGLHNFRDGKATRSAEVTAIHGLEEAQWVLPIDVWEREIPELPGLGPKGIEPVIISGLHGVCLRIAITSY
jgi:hypothetical protein